MVRRNIGILLCILALTLGGCRGEDSGAYDRGMQALASADYETAMGEFQKAANEDGRKAEAYRGEGIIYLRRQEDVYKRQLSADVFLPPEELGT